MPAGPTRVSILARIAPALSYGVPALGAAISALMLIRVFQAMRNAEAAGLAAVSAGVREANFPVYASSKAALNMLTIRYAAAFPGMRINSVDPGFTATDFNEYRGHRPLKRVPR